MIETPDGRPLMIVVPVYFWWVTVGGSYDRTECTIDGASLQYFDGQGEDKPGRSSRSTATSKGKIPLEFVLVIATWDISQDARFHAKAGGVGSVVARYKKALRAGDYRDAPRMQKDFAWPTTLKPKRATFTLAPFVLNTKENADSPAVHLANRREHYEFWNEWLVEQAKEWNAGHIFKKIKVVESDK